jgi:predicted RNA binding protein YcfA (HicA-like mRNA interferase family)
MKFKNTVDRDQLIKLMTKSGFIQRSKGSHGIFIHAEQKIIITIPLAHKDIPSIYSRSVYKQLIDSKLIPKSSLLEIFTIQ